MTPWPKGVHQPGTVPAFCRDLLKRFPWEQLDALNELDRHAFFRYHRLGMSAHGIVEGQCELLRVIEQTLPMRAPDAARLPTARRRYAARGVRHHRRGAVDYRRGGNELTHLPNMTLYVIPLPGRL